jgi:hypothetical protein
MTILNARMLLRKFRNVFFIETAVGKDRLTVPVYRNIASRTALLPFKDAIFYQERRIIALSLGSLYKQNFTTITSYKISSLFQPMFWDFPK